MQKNLLFGGLLAVALLLSPATVQAQGLDNQLDGGLNTMGLATAETDINQDLNLALQFAALTFQGKTNFSSVQNAGLTIGLAFAFFNLAFTSSSTTFDFGIYSGIVEFYSFARILVEVTINVYIPAVLVDIGSSSNLNFIFAFLTQALQGYTTMNTICNSQFGFIPFPGP
jgi:hypothetical protein